MRQGETYRRKRTRFFKAATPHFHPFKLDAQIIIGVTFFVSLTVTGMNLWGSIVTAGLVCTFYVTVVS